MLKFNLDKQVNLTYYDQIKGQLLSAIYCGKIQEGDRLPSIQELTDSLAINYKTVRKIYLRLAQEDYIEIVKSSGTFLKKRSGERTYERMQRQAIFRLLEEIIDKAKNLGLSSKKFIELLENYATGGSSRKISLAVIDHQEEAFIFSRELEMRLGVKALPVSLDQLKGDESFSLFQESDYLLTTSWHMEEVRMLAGQHLKKLVELKPSHEIYTEIMTATQDQNVAIVIQDEQTLHASWEIFMNLYHPSTKKKFWIAPIAREDLVEKIIQEADLIFVSPMCWDEMRKRAPASKQLKTYENFISQETINHLRELQLLG